LLDHLPGHGVDGGLAGRDGQALPGDEADAGAALECHAGPIGPADPGADFRAVGDIRVVTGVLDDPRLAGGLVPMQVVREEGDPLAAGQGEGDTVDRSLFDLRVVLVCFVLC
jgi:hypothetical protein